MTTDPILQLVYGTRTLNLNDGSRYALEPGFTPPAALLSVQMSDGTSANRTGGATKIGQRAQNRQWSFSVQCLGSSERDVTRAFQDLAVFMSYAGIDRSVPLYLEYKPNSDINFKPLWGQDGWLRYEVRHANAPQIGERYGSTDFRARNVTALISIEVAPYAEGLQQRLCTATGGIIEDTIGTVDGISRGLIVAEATCNLFTNPVFGNATWNTGWTAAASLLSASSIDSRYLLPGTTVSAKLVASASTANTFLQDVTLSASQHAIWSVIKLPDGGTPASTMMQMAYNGSTLTTEFASAGNGLWYAVASAIGTAGSASAGVVVKRGYTIYLLAAQAEKKTYRTPLCWGDLLGCAWTSTAHASTSTRTLASAKLLANDLGLSGGAGSISTTIKVPGTSFYSGTFSLWAWYVGASNYLWAYYYNGSFTLLYYNGTSYSTLGAVTLSAGGTYQVDVTWDGSAGLKMFVNGAQIGTTQTDKSFVALSGGTLYIGSYNGSAYLVNCTLMKLVIYDRALTATQIANDYANQSQVLADGQRLGAVPWLWTKDGDNVVDNCLDTSGSTGSPHDNFCVCGGIAGTERADTRIKGILSSAFSVSSSDSLFLSLMAMSKFNKPIDNLISDENTVSDTDCSGGGYKLSLSLSTTETLLTGATFTAAMMKEMRGREVFLFGRLYDAGANLTLSMVLTVGGYYAMATDYSSVSSSSEFRLHKTKSLIIPDLSDVAESGGVIPTTTFRLYAKRTTGSDSLRTDYVFLVARPLVKLSVLGSYVSGTGTEFVYHGTKGNVLTPTDLLDTAMSVTGDVIELEPEKLNVLISFIGNTDVASVIAYTLTYSKVLITPRWGLL